MKDLFLQFVDDFDYAPHSKKAYISDLNKFRKWFEEYNKETLSLPRITLQDITGFRNHLQKTERQAVATINRCIVAIRKFIDWAVKKGIAESNPAQKVKEIKRQQRSPKGLGNQEVRKLLREIELRGDVRGMAIVCVFLYSGCRVSDLVGITTDDLTIKERSGCVRFIGKGNKYRVVPLPLAARQAITRYLEVRPRSVSNRLFLGERGPLSDKGIRHIIKNYSRFIGVDLHCHLFRHTFSKQYLKDVGDIVTLSQLLGHTSLNTTRLYCERSDDEIMELSEKVSY